MRPSFEDLRRIIKQANIVLLIQYGRGGLFLTHSFLDNHEQLVTMPVDMRHYTLFDVKRGVRSNIDRFIASYPELWSFSKTVLAKDSFFSNFKYPAESDYTLSADEYRRVLHELCGVCGPQSRRDFFILANIAYHMLRNGNIKGIKYILVNAHITKRRQLAAVCRDFPRRKVILTGRDPRESIYSLAQYYLKCECGQENAEMRIPAAYLYQRILFHFSLFGRCALAAGGLPGGDVRAVDLNWLHEHGETALSKIAAWLEIGLSPSLYESTFNGAPYMGNMAVKRSNTLNAAYASLNFRRNMPQDVISLCDVLFSRIYEKLGYRAAGEAISDGRLAKSLLLNAVKGFILPVPKKMMSYIMSISHGSSATGGVCHNFRAAVAVFLFLAKLYISTPLSGIVLFLIMRNTKLRLKFSNILADLPDAETLRLR